MSEGHEENQDMQRISKKIKNYEACLSEDTPMAGRSEFCSKGRKRLLKPVRNRGFEGAFQADNHLYAPAYNKKKTSPQALPVIRDRDRDRGRVRDRVPSTVLFGFAPG